SPSQLEGTFYFPLPPDASLSRLAMYVEGEDGFCQLMEGGIAEAGEAREVYETIRYANRDPALLEWLDGSTFKMRVFPLEGRKEKRLLLSYTQRLPVLYDQATYRFPAGHTLQTVRDWSFHARVKGGADLAHGSPSHPLKAARDGNDLLLDAAATNAKVDRDVGLQLTDPRQAAGHESAARVATAEAQGAAAGGGQRIGRPLLVGGARGGALPDGALPAGADRRAEPAAARLGVPVRVLRRPRPAAGPRADRPDPPPAGPGRPGGHLRR